MLLIQSQTQTYFLAETRTVFDQHLSFATNDLLSSLRTVRDLNHANALLTSTQSNYHTTYITIRNHSDVQAMIPYPFNYTRCSCSQSPFCTEQAAVYEDYSQSVAFTVPGLYIGCYMTEAILQSNLGCFYNQTCLDQLLPYLLGESTLDVVALDPSSLVRFSVQSTVQELVNNLMVEQWDFSSSFDDYYNQCRPAQCTYSVITRNDAINIVTTLFGLVGGLSTILGVAVPVGVRTVVYLCRRFRGAVNPDVVV
jgi:hypothetical protein